MFDFQENKTIIFAIVGIIIGAIFLYFVYERQTKKLVQNELRKIFVAKKNKIVKNTNTNINNNNNNNNNMYVEDDIEMKEDMDSYVDPLGDDDMGETKLNSHNIMMRDVIDGL